MVGAARCVREAVQSCVAPSSYHLHNEMGSNCKTFCVSRRNFVIAIVLFSCQLRGWICPENRILFCVVLTEILSSFQLFLFLTRVYRRWQYSRSPSICSVFKELRGHLWTSSQNKNLTAFGKSLQNYLRHLVVILVDVLVVERWLLKAVG